MRSVKVYPENWPLRSPFMLAGHHHQAADVVVVELEQDGISVQGECTPYAGYGESEASVLSQISALLPVLEQGLERQQLQAMLPAGAARNAIDSALWQLESAVSGKSLWQLTGFEPLTQIETAQTVCLDTPEAMASSALAQWENGVHLLKIKLDDHLIAERLVAIRSAVPQATLIVDANGSWHSEGLAARCQLLADLRVAMLEQPLPPHEDEALTNFIHPLPVCADESCHTRDDLPRLAGRYEMVNIKLDKAGGLTEALALAAEAQAQGFVLVVSCLLCTSRAIRMALPLAHLARFSDLDGPSWLATDVKDGLPYRYGRIDFAADNQ